MYLRVTGLLIVVPVSKEVSGHVFTCYMSFAWSACTKGCEWSCIYVLQVFWLKCLFQGKWAVMYLRVTGLLIEVPVRREVSGHVFTCYRSFDWSACTKGGEQSCIYVLQVFWLKWLYQGKWTVMYLRLTGLLIEVPVPREVSGHVFKCYMSFDWSACTKGSERSCIYVLHVFWLKCLYQGKWTVMYLRVTGLLIELLVPSVAVMYLRVTGLLMEVPVPREVSAHVFRCYRSFDWSDCTKGSERSCIDVLQVFWLKCLYQGKWVVMYYVLHVFWLKWLYQGKWVVMYLRVTGLLIEVTLPREVSGHVFTCYRSFDWSACTKGSERSCIYVLQVFWLKCLYQGKWVVMYLRVTCLLIEVTVPREVSGRVFTCYRYRFWLLQRFWYLTLELFGQWSIFFSFPFFFFFIQFNIISSIWHMAFYGRTQKLCMSNVNEYYKYIFMLLLLFLTENNQGLELKLCAKNFKLKWVVLTLIINIFNIPQIITSSVHDLTHIIEHRLLSQSQDAIIIFVSYFSKTFRGCQRFYQPMHSCRAYRL
jgi:hypothetical protein